MIIRGFNGNGLASGVEARSLVAEFGDGRIVVSGRVSSDSRAIMEVEGRDGAGGGHRALLLRPRGGNSLDIGLPGPIGAKRYHLDRGDHTEACEATGFVVELGSGFTVLVDDPREVLTPEFFRLTVNIDWSRVEMRTDGTVRTGTTVQIRMAGCNLIRIVIDHQSVGAPR